MIPGKRPSKAAQTPQSAFTSNVKQTQTRVLGSNHISTLRTTKTRTSSHHLKIETGRYNQHLSKVNLGESERLCQRRCDFCTSDNIESLSVLPYGHAEIPILEDEHHVLVSCPKYHNLRSALHPSLKSLILRLRDESHHLLLSREHSKKFGQYVKHIFELRFPKVKQTDLY